MIEEIYEKRIHTILTEEEKILMIQKSDERLRELVEILQKEFSERSPEEKNKAKEYEVYQGRLYKKGLRRYIKRHIRGCFECLIMKVPGGKRPELLHPPRIPQWPMLKVHLDHLGPFPKCKRGYMHILYNLARNKRKDGRIHK
ncbi:hypothetical protein ABEB36_009442 [Hypothenemus hampei]|uniref:Uncharacterized protein n=1 Tax=Hypothenemus hampei TaxID=57062 RepID=A0ABD1EIH4_HYPHA